MKIYLCSHESLSNVTSPSFEVDLHFQDQTCWHFIWFTNISSMMTDRDKHYYCYQIWNPVCALDCCIYIWFWLIVKVKGQCQVFLYLAINSKKLPVYWADNLSMCYLLSDLSRLLARPLPRSCCYWFSLTESSTVTRPIGHINLFPGSNYIFTIKSRQRLSFVTKLILFWPTSPSSTETFADNRGRTSDCSWEKYT